MPEFSDKMKLFFINMAKGVCWGEFNDTSKFTDAKNGSVTWQISRMNQLGDVLLFTDTEAMCQRWNSTMERRMVTTRRNIFKTIGQEFLSHRTPTTVEVATFRRTTLTMGTWLWKHAQGSGTTGCSRHTIGSRTLIMTGRKSCATLPR